MNCGSAARIKRPHSICFTFGSRHVITELSHIEQHTRAGCHWYSGTCQQAHNRHSSEHSDRFLKMSTALLQPPTSSSPPTVLSLSQRGSNFLKAQSMKIPWPYPLSLLVNNESQEKWQIYENVFLACLRTGDNDSAYLCLEEITDRFGKANERVMALQGLYREATAENAEQLDEVMRQYEDLLKEDPTLFAVRKRRAALLKSMGRIPEAVNAMTNLVDASPTDAEAWAELADLYLTQGSYEQAIFCLEEVLLVTPNAWNMHARLGEVLFLSAQRLDGGDQMKTVSESMRRFCRSVELCDDYLRGYYGLKLVRAVITCTSQTAFTDMMADILPPPSKPHEYLL